MYNTTVWGYQQFGVVQQFGMTNSLGLTTVWDDLKFGMDNRSGWTTVWDDQQIGIHMSLVSSTICNTPAFNAGMCYRSLRGINDIRLGMFNKLRSHTVMCI